MADVATRGEAHPYLRGARLRLVMAALMLTLLLEALDQTVVGTAMPRIIGTLHGFDRYTWAITAYLLASTTMIPLSGGLSDRFGRKGFLAAGVVIFLAGSALCGAARSIDQLIAFRALQGLGAGIGISLVFAAVGDVVPGADRARWQGALSGVYGFASVIGPGLGGWLADHGPVLGALVTPDSRWRWVFYVNLPVGVVALLVLQIYFPSPVARRRNTAGRRAVLARIDFVGALLEMAATVSLLVSLTIIGEGSASLPPLVPLGLLAALVLSVIFLQVERRAAEPVLPLELFRNRVFAADAVLSLLLYMALFGMAFYVPLFLQGALGVSPTEAGAAMTPFSISIVAGNALASLAITRWRRYHAVVLAGALIMTLGAVLTAGIGLSTPVVAVSAFVVVAGVGMGVLFTATAVVVQSAVPAGQLGAGFGVVRYLGQVGGTLGVALVGTVVIRSFVAGVAGRLSPGMVRHLAQEHIVSPSNPQALINPSYRETVTQMAVRAASRGLSGAPRHAAVEHQLQLLGQWFAALRVALAAAIQYGLMLDVVFCLGAVVVAPFVKDVALSRSPPDH